MLSNLFPHRESIRNAARLSLMIEQARAQGQPVHPHWLNLHAAALARFERLPAHEQQYVATMYQQDREHQAIATNTAHQQSAASAFNAQVNDLTRQLTPGLAGRAHGVGMELASALRNHGKVTVRARKLPTGAEADARVQRATGMTQKEYAKKLDKALEVRDRAKNGNWQEWRDYVAANFPGESFSAVNKLVKGWTLESVGLEMQRRAQADQPDTVELRATPEDQRRLDIVEAISEVEGANPRSLFHKGHAERLQEIVAEGVDREGRERPGELGLRADIARAMLDHGGTFNVNTGGRGEGHEGDFATEEIVEVSDEE